MAKDKNTIITEDKKKIDKLMLPIALTVLGIGALTIAVILASRANDKKRMAEDGNYDVENYDVVKGKPFIF